MMISQKCDADIGATGQTVRTEPQRTLVKCTEITTGDA